MVYRNYANLYQTLQVPEKERYLSSLEMTDNPNAKTINKIGVDKIMKR